MVGEGLSDIFVGLAPSPRLAAQLFRYRKSILFFQFTFPAKSSTDTDLLQNVEYQDRGIRTRASHVIGDQIASDFTLHRALYMIHFAGTVVSMRN